MKMNRVFTIAGLFGILMGFFAAQASAQADFDELLEQQYTPWPYSLVGPLEPFEPGVEEEVDDAVLFLKGAFLFFSSEAEESLIWLEEVDKELHSDIGGPDEEIVARLEAEIMALLLAETDPGKIAEAQALIAEAKALDNEVKSLEAQLKLDLDQWEKAKVNAAKAAKDVIDELALADLPAWKRIMVAAAGPITGNTAIGIARGKRIAGYYREWAKQMVIMGIIEDRCDGLRRDIRTRKLVSFLLKNTAKKILQGGGGGSE